MDVKKIKEIILSGNLDKFYKNKDWLIKRAEALKRDNNECQMCKANGKVTIAQCVHHKKHLKDHPELALDINNLKSLCNACHNSVHPEKQFKQRVKPKIDIEERW